MIVQQYLAALSKTWQRQHTAYITTRNHTYRYDLSVGIKRACKTHFVAARKFDSRANGDCGFYIKPGFAKVCGTCRCIGDACFGSWQNSGLDTAQVFRGFFLAAGNNTLFKINRYPGEFGCNDKSVGAAPIECCGSSGSCPPRNVHEPLP